MKAETVSYADVEAEEAQVIPREGVESDLHQQLLAELFYACGRDPERGS